MRAALAKFSPVALQLKRCLPWDR